MAFQPFIQPTSSSFSPSGGFQPFLSSGQVSNNPGYVSPKQVSAPKTSTPPSFIQNIWDKAISFFSNAPEVKATNVNNLISPVPKSQMLPQAINRPVAQAAQFVGDTAAGIINTPSEAARSSVDLAKNNKTNTWQQNAGDIGAIIQLPLLFLGGGAAEETVAGAVSKEAVANIAKQFGKNVTIGGAFGLTGGLQSGRQITNTNDYLKNLINNVTSGVEFGAVAGLVPHAVSTGASAIKAGTTHIAIPLAKGASTKVGSLFIKNPSTNPSIEHLQLDPKVAQSTVIGNDKVAASPVGKAVIKASVEAQQTNQQVAITVAKDGKYTLSSGEKVNVSTAPEYQPKQIEAPKNAGLIEAPKTQDNNIKGEGFTIADKANKQDLETMKSINTYQTSLDRYNKNSTPRNLKIVQNARTAMQDNTKLSNQSHLDNIKFIQKSFQAEGNHPQLVDIAKTLTKNIGTAIAQFKVEGKAASAFITAHNPTSDISFTRFKGAIQELSDTYGGHYREISDMIKTGQIGEKEYGTYQATAQAESHSESKGANNQNSQNTSSEGNKPQASSAENGATSQNSIESKGNTRSNEGSNEHAGNGTDTNTKPNEQSRSGTTDTKTTESSSSSEPKLNTPSKIALSVQQKALDKGLTDKLDLAGYDKIQIKSQSEMGMKLANDREKLINILRGDEPIPEGMNPVTPIIVAEEHFKATGDPEMLREIANSPLITETSKAGQILRMAREREKDSVSAKLADLRQARLNAVEKRYGKTYAEVKKDTVDQIKNTVKTPNKNDWKSFIKNIQC